MDSKLEILGTFLGFVGGVGTGLSHYIESVLVGYLNPYVVMWCIGFPMLGLSVVVSFKTDLFHAIQLKEFVLMMIRNLSSIFAIITNILSLSYIPVYETEMIRCAETIFIPAMAMGILKQPPKLSMLIALVFNIIGIFVVYRPSWLISRSKATSGEANTEQRLIGIILALMSAFFISMYKIMGKLIPNINSRITTIYENCLHVVILTIVAFIMDVEYLPVNFKDWLLICAIGSSYLVVTLSYTVAFKLAPAAYVGFASMSFLPTSIILKSCIEKKYPSVYDFIGMALILTSVFISLFDNLLSKCVQMIKNKHKLVVIESNPLKDIESTPLKPLKALH